MSTSVEQCERLSATRNLTRMELYKRLSQARNFIEKNIDKPISLSQVADVACLSSHHFLRLFKQVFGETPHQYLTRKRIERAKDLLLTTPISVTGICQSVGFKSPGSFSWLFRRHVGYSPEGFRAVNSQK
ncbi:MAG: helix-turn-helix transcriptional regulator [Armatimonadetes bacterium]|nr:helix-turn-helix transcriptional regulator [Armatimonadota bacterium]